MRYRSVLVENEEPSLKRLDRLLEAFPDEVDIVGTAMDGPTAVEVIKALRPDLVFLDIDLPGCNGFQVLEQLDYQPTVIFTTAFNQHALDAFKAHAIDYLLKPIESESVARALGKLKSIGANQAEFSRTLQQLVEALGSKYVQRLSFKDGNRTMLVKTGEILYIQADRKLSSVHTVSRSFLDDRPLVWFEKKLDPRDFVRIHRATLVNSMWIAEIHRWYDGKLKVVLKDAKSTELVVSRMYSENLRNL